MTTQTYLTGLEDLSQTILPSEKRVWFWISEVNLDIWNYKNWPRVQQFGHPFLYCDKDTN